VMDSNLHVRPQAECLESGFDRDEEGYEMLVGRCVRNIAVFGGVALTNRPGGGRRIRPLVSQPLRVWHIVDVLRFGTERLRTITAALTFQVPSWDENLVTEVQSYDHLSPMVGLIALLSAADTWRTAAYEAPHDVSTPHPEAGSICASDVVQRMRTSVPPPVGRAARNRRLIHLDLRHRRTRRRAIDCTHRTSAQRAVRSTRSPFLLRSSSPLPDV
jgi:hypothetical protein